MMQPSEETERNRKLDISSLSLPSLAHDSERRGFSGVTKLLILAGILSPWYFFTGKKDTSDISSIQTFRHLATTQGSFLAGVGASSVAAVTGSGPVLVGGALLGTWLACKFVADQVLKRVIPYEHEV